MKYFNHSFKKRLTWTLILLCFLAACEKDKKDNDNQSDNASSGYLKVLYTCAYPEWSERSVMNVEIGPDGTVQISSAGMEYAGETMISADSKIERYGSWDMNPEGNIENQGKNVFVDAHLIVIDDVTKVYEKDNSGNWVLVLETPGYTGEVATDLSFNYKQATENAGGDQISVNQSTGSMVWTLNLIPFDMPCDWMNGNPFKGKWIYAGDSLMSELTFKDDMSVSIIMTEDPNGTPTSDTSQYVYEYTKTTLTLKDGGVKADVTEYVTGNDSLKLSLFSSDYYTYVKSK